MAWGLIPLATPTSGYGGVPGVLEVPLDDADKAAAVITKWQSVDVETLHTIRVGNWTLLDDHYNWSRFSVAVADAIVRLTRRLTSLHDAETRQCWR